MKLSLLLIGRTEPAWLQEGCESYVKRITRYLPFRVQTLPDVRNPRNMPVQVLTAREAEIFLGSLQATDTVVLLDEKGAEMDTMGLAGFLQSQMTASTRHLVFVVAGAFGAAPALRERASYTLSLSRLTFPHQLVRLLVLEQLYRALTILKNEPYHNQ